MRLDVVRFVLAGYALGAFGLGTLGCAGRGGALAGHWKFKEADFPPSQAKKKIALAAREIFKNMSLDLASDGSYKLNLVVPTTGAWRLSDHTLTLTPEKIEGLSAAEFRDRTPTVAKGDPDLTHQETLISSDDGKSLKMHRNIGFDCAVVLTKSEG